MSKLIKNLLLLALPASGKSEVRRYLASLTPTQCREEFHLGPTVQLDDFPYVHLMRRIDEELTRRGEPTIFFPDATQPFRDPRDWGTLIELLNEDYAGLMAGTRQIPPQAAAHLFARLDRCRERVGAPAALATLSEGVRTTLADALEAEATQLYRDLRGALPETMEGRTIVMEFARGGADGSPMPLPPPYGYHYSLSRLAPEILRDAAILYIWVTPEESRRKNAERTDPDDPGSILNHGVPIDVLLNDYGCDDMAHLMADSDRPGTLRIEAHGTTFHLPVARFDNRQDKTTFIRKERTAWGKEEIAAVHRDLKTALDQLV